MRREWWAPLSGAAFVLLLIASFIVSGEPPEADEGAAKVVEFYVDNDDSITVGVILSGLAALMLLFFGAVLRKALTAARGEQSVLADVAFAGTVVMATGAMIDSTLLLALSESVEDIEPASVLALQAFWDNDFLPIALGVVALLLGAGAAIVRTGLLPRWLGWIAIALAVVGLTPIGFAAFMGGALWVIVVSVLLAMGARAALAPPPVAPPPPAPPVV